MYGEQATKLAQDAKRTENLPHLPPYNTTTIRAVTKEVRDLDRESNALLSPYSVDASQSTNGSQSQGSKTSFIPSEHPALASTLLVHQLSMRRNKRCLLAYHKTRTDKLEQFCWEGVDVTELTNSSNANANNDTGGSNVESGNSAAANATSSLSAEEEQYTHAYSALLSAYKGQWSDIDLTGSLDPPKDIFIDVRVLKDAGEIQTEYGSITLTKNSQFYVRAGDVEGLIRQGYLQRLG
ncbi:Putative GINS complex, subunit Psf1, GINS subunit, domain A protein [Septoria linicola]|uniref:DNA replication complex GINS protein PSF1 n=1 Tax=Septoria linicola TaxID=215465 RepID=A0A9Q9AH96_9PEZI|nr:putative GINS complex, subunit Psf1, GINS subunit, domain A protein [Septoria linicola]USW47634.1 Putative GINS complex, subunit Psf1, GINS subunit, domain A protein [Septoria linicola]